MPIILDHQFREKIPHKATEFPVTYYHDELEELSNWAGPFHWHPDFEIATAASGSLDYQIGQQHIILEAGDSIFVNGNVLHRIRQLAGERADPMPNIVFSGGVIASEHSTIYEKYVRPVVQCNSLPFIVFRRENKDHREVNRIIQDTYNHLNRPKQCHEMAVQRNISRIFEYIFLNFDSFPKSEATRIEIKSQIRLQKMLTYIYEHYGETVTLQDIANAANISRSEAGRCFLTYMGSSPMDTLIQYRLQAAHRLLRENTLTLQEISFACGFNSVNYFSRRFKRAYGYSPGKEAKPGK